jgi:hypothetical protein
VLLRRRITPGRTAAGRALAGHARGAVGRAVRPVVQGGGWRRRVRLVIGVGVVIELARPPLRMQQMAERVARDALVLHLLVERTFAGRRRERVGGVVLSPERELRRDVLLIANRRHAVLEHARRLRGDDGAPARGRLDALPKVHEERGVAVHGVRGLGEQLLLALHALLESLVISELDEPARELEEANVGLFEAGDRALGD